MYNGTYVDNILIIRAHSDCATANLLELAPQDLSHSSFLRFGQKLFVNTWITDPNLLYFTEKYNIIMNIS